MDITEFHKKLVQYREEPDSDLLEQFKTGQIMPADQLESELSDIISEQADKLRKNNVEGSLLYDLHAILAEADNLEEFASSSESQEHLDESVHRMLLFSCRILDWSEKVDSLINQLNEG